MINMNKRIFLLLIFFIFLFTTKPIFAQTLDNPVPGVDCGIAGAEEGKDKCCYQKYDLPEPPKTTIDLGLLGKFNADLLGVVETYNQYKTKIDGIKNTAQNPCPLGEPTTKIYDDPNCKCVLSLTPTAIPEIKELCEKYLDGDERERCNNCTEGEALWTGIGCVPLKVWSLINDYLLKIGVGLGGIIALLCIIYAALQMQLSQGSPEKIKKTQELLTSCIMGLMLIIFSVFILRVIGVDILRIPGFW